MFEKFSESARRVLFHARYEASKMGSSSIGTDHLLLGILKESGEITQELFSRARVPIKLLQAEIGHLLLLAIGAAYGITDEWHQMYVPGRMPDVVDWLADVAGLVTGYAIAATFLNRSNVHESEESVR